jgi:serine/threonine-protein kinase
VYEMLCGRRPFEDEVKTKVLVLHTTQPPPSPTEFRPSLSGRLARAVLKGLAKDPSERYPNCAALAAAVREAVMADRRATGRVRADRLPLLRKGVTDLPRRSRQARASRPACPLPRVQGAADSVRRRRGGAEAGLSGSEIVRGGTSVLAPRGGSGRYALEDGPRSTPPAAPRRRLPGGHRGGLPAHRGPIRGARPGRRTARLRRRSIDPRGTAPQGDGSGNRPNRCRWRPLNRAPGAFGPGPARDGRSGSPWARPPCSPPRRWASPHGDSPRPRGRAGRHVFRRPCLSDERGGPR